MCFQLAVVAVLALFLTADQVHCQGTTYEFHDIKLEFLNPVGLRISIPDDRPDIYKVDFHICINEEDPFYRNSMKKSGGRWTKTIPEFMVKQGDQLHYQIDVTLSSGGARTSMTETIMQRNPHRVVVTPDNVPDNVIDNVPDNVPDYVPYNGPYNGPFNVPYNVPGYVPYNVPCFSSEESQTKWDEDHSACMGEVLLQTTFSHLNHWSHEVHIGGSLPEDEFTVFTKDSDVSFVENGKLVIKPILLENKYNESFITRGHLQLQGCTSIIPHQCGWQAVTFMILPPVMSARLKTKFSFRYGIIEVLAKLPRGDWVVPELWLQPKSGGVDRITLALSKGNAAFNSRLEAGFILNNTLQTRETTGNSPWSNDYHMYQLTWTPDSMVFAVDNQEYANLRDHKFNEECYITLGVHVAGIRDFKDDSNKPWNNTDPKRLVTFWQAKDSWLPSWDQNSLRVDYLKVTAL